MIATGNALATNALTEKCIPTKLQGISPATDFKIRFLLWSVCCLLLAFSHNLYAEDYTANFDGPRVSWEARCRDNEVRLSIHERRRDEGHIDGCELVRLKALLDDVPARIEHEITPTRVLDEFEARVWVKSDRPGAIFAVRINFKDTTDPETGGPLAMIIPGDTYQGSGEWRELTCRTSEKAVNDQLRILRARKKGKIDTTLMYIDRVLIGCNLQAGTTELWIDELHASPIVRAEVDQGTPPALTQVGGRQRNRIGSVVESPGSQSHSASEAIGTRATSGIVPIEFRLHRLRVEDRPFFPIISSYREERPESLATAGFNVAWVSDSEVARLAPSMRRQKLWLTTTPPFARDGAGEPLESEDASLLSFNSSTAPILFWMMGARMNASGRPKLQSWTNQVRDADRQNKRPLAADIADDEKLCSRHLDLVGISRHVLNSELSLVDYRESLIQKRDRAWPGTFCWTWIQTEPTPELIDSATSTDTTPVIEPEQLRMQVYAALAAGCRGVGYWTTTPLDGEGPVARERLLALTQLNLELTLMEPWLATGSSVQLIPFQINGAAAEAAVPIFRSQSPNRSIMNGTSLPGARGAATNQGRFGLGMLTSPATPAPRRGASSQPDSHLMAALIPSEFGAILLPMWLDDHSQFVPGQLAANDATIVVPGGFETATAWEFSTTGRLRHLNREKVAGGMKIVLPKFDQTAAILITTDTKVVEKLNYRIEQLQSRSAMVSVELSQLKLERVQKVHQQLQQLGVAHPQGTRLLSDAKSLVERADGALKQQQLDAARQAANDAMQRMRMYQRAQWEASVKALPTPVVSPYALCFQTLPEHWRLLRSKRSDHETSAVNMLPSGAFEDLDTVIASGWRHEQRAIPGVQSAAELHPSAKEGQYSLRLAARPVAGEQPPRVITKSPVTIVSPPITVHAGQVVRISGWVKMPDAVEGSLDGAAIHDSLLGKTAALHLKPNRDWQHFEFDRVVGASQEMTLTVALNGLGELIIDDVRVTASAPQEALATTPIKDPAVKPTKHSPLESLDIRRLLPSGSKNRSRN